MVVLQPVVPSGFFPLNAVADAADRELHKKDNVAKLSAAGRRAELFVWLDVTPAQAALITLTQPPFDRRLREIRLPSLPGGVTAVWLAAGLADWPRPAAALLHTDGRRWRIAGPPVLTLPA